MKNPLEIFKKMKPLHQELKQEKLEVKEMTDNVLLQQEEILSINDKVNEMSREFEVVMPQNEMLRKWVELVTGFMPLEVTEVLRLERMYPGMMEKVIQRAKHQNMQPEFDDFVYAARDEALYLLNGNVTGEQAEILREMKLKTHAVLWGEVETYSLRDLVSVPKEMQDAFADYVYSNEPAARDKMIAAALESIARAQAIAKADEELPRS